MTPDLPGATDLAGRLAIVTGGASGIGAACARHLAACGARIVVLDRDAAGAAQVAAALPDPGRHLPLAADLAGPDAIDGVFARLDAQGLRAGILVNSAGIREIAAPLDLTRAEWQRVIDINLTASFFMCQGFARRLRDAGLPGAIVNLASTSSFLAARNRAAYGASKFGVAGITRQLAYELGELGIRVNAVAPGVVRTPLTEAYFARPDTEDRLARAYPLGRAATPEDVAAAVLFLVSDAARYVTGTVMPVDGGYTAGKGW